ncbi:DUF4738 domain-containing protein [Paracrocinitomix mangrovi]|uniref:DUF4738 domain-containing protein n=1 Tax=Paracrocinitomix mangrovi TaxID=2862509 RepID=UPI001C8EEB4D|nr:DUF4738 domain-containing protein [Paracrocinitomix mangrovi]UKN03466.1 DUF4738 domain-containing protein [Paracrocinitomix mangrovi]
MVFASCSNQEPESYIQQVDNKQNVIYSEPNFDTTIQNMTLSMYNEDYQLEIKMYSLNDSLVKNPIYINSEEYDTITKVTHNNVASIILNKGSQEIFQKTVYKETFEDSLDPEMMDNIHLYSVNYEAVRTNRLYFEANLGVPETEVTFEAQLAIFYQTDKLGRLDYWGVKPLE